MEPKASPNPNQLAALSHIEQPPGLGWIDAFDAKTSLLSGWAADPVQQGPAHGVFAIVDDNDRIAFRGSYGSARPDVAAFHRNQRLTNVGLILRVPVSELDRGAHSVQLAVVSSDGKGYYLVPGKVEFFLSN